MLLNGTDWLSHLSTWGLKKPSLRLQFLVYFCNLCLNLVQKFFSGTPWQYKSWDLVHTNFYHIVWYSTNKLQYLYKNLHFYLGLEAWSISPWSRFWLFLAWNVKKISIILFKRNCILQPFSWIKKFEYSNFILKYKCRNCSNALFLAMHCGRFRWILYKNHESFDW